MFNLKSVCSNCNDTHWVSSCDEVGESKEQMCNYCPLPCNKCGLNGPYCIKTPCECNCHTQLSEEKLLSTDGFVDGFLAGLLAARNTCEALTCRNRIDKLIEKSKSELSQCSVYVQALKDTAELCDKKAKYYYDKGPLHRLSNDYESNNYDAQKHSVALELAKEIREMIIKYIIK